MSLNKQEIQGLTRNSLFFTKMTECTRASEKTYFCRAASGLFWVGKQLQRKQNRAKHRGQDRVLKITKIKNAV